MPDFVEQPRDYAAAQVTRATEPYHYQRDRQYFNRQPRPSQPNISQPNQKNAVVGWGMSSQDYWQGVFKNYISRKRLTQDTSLRMGRDM